jgi:hypothetical protein
LAQHQVQAGRKLMVAQLQNDVRGSFFVYQLQVFRQVDYPYPGYLGHDGAVEQTAELGSKGVFWPHQIPRYVAPTQ